MTTILEGYTKREISRLRTRFWFNVHEDGRDHDLPAESCWEWLGARFKNGGPVAGTKRRVYPARYLAYALEVEDFEEGHYILSMCRNPLCVNPAHLRLAVRRPENDVSAEAKIAAVAAINAAVWQTKTLPQASTQACSRCGYRAAHYHHYLGYEPEHWLDVIALCAKCHYQAEWKVIREPGPVYIVNLS